MYHSRSNKIYLNLSFLSWETKFSISTLVKNFLKSFLSISILKKSWCNLTLKNLSQNFFIIFSARYAFFNFWIVIFSLKTILDAKHATCGLFQEGSLNFFDKFLISSFVSFTSLSGLITLKIFLLLHQDGNQINRHNL